MSYSALPSEWTRNFTDPYAILGIPVAADDRRVLRRYREIAMLLHPDRYAINESQNQELATQLFARLVNPAYERLRQERGRAEHTALLRLKVRRLSREGPLQLKSDIARTLMEHPASGVDVSYEKSVSDLAEAQYRSFEEFESLTQQLSELNLAYLQLKMSDGIVRERRTGLIAAEVARPVQFTPVPTNPEVVTESYDQRHYRRAQEYAKQEAWTQAIQELRDAIRIKADKSEYHSLLGVSYLRENRFPGMARVHLKRAYELNPKDPLVLRFGSKVGLPVAPYSRSSGKANKAGKRPQPSKPAAKSIPSSNGVRKSSSSSQQRSFWDWLLGRQVANTTSGNGSGSVKSDKRGWLTAWFGGR